MCIFLIFLGAYLYDRSLQKWGWRTTFNKQYSRNSAEVSLETFLQTVSALSFHLSVFLLVEPQVVGKTHGQWPFQGPKLEVPTRFKGISPQTIAWNMVQYHFRILKFPLTTGKTLPCRSQLGPSSNWTSSQSPSSKHFTRWWQRFTSSCTRTPWVGGTVRHLAMGLMMESM